VRSPRTTATNNSIAAFAAAAAAVAHSRSRFDDQLDPVLLLVLLLFVVLAVFLRVIIVSAFRLVHDDDHHLSAAYTTARRILPVLVVVVVPTSFTISLHHRSSSPLSSSRAMMMKLSVSYRPPFIISGATKGRWIHGWGSTILAILASIARVLRFIVKGESTYRTIFQRCCLMHVWRMKKKVPPLSLKGEVSSSMTSMPQLLSCRVSRRSISLSLSLSAAPTNQRRRVGS
jgi:hypothetical protein